jgi:uncharacterized protein YbjT (DUF2867 family)
VKVIVFGATGMVGQGVLRECLLDRDVDSVLVLGRNPTGLQHDKLRELVRQDLFDLSDVADQLAGYDACFFCLGVSSTGMSEADYRRVTYDLTLGAARILAEHNPNLTFVYVSGAGTDEHGRAMWARVKGKTEADLLALPFNAYMFRPGIIQATHGERSRTRLYAILYPVMAPLIPIIRRVAPRAVTTTDGIGKAMLHLARAGSSEHIFDNAAINALA